MRRLLPVFAWVLVAAVPAAAQEWQTTDSRSEATGGAGIARTDGSITGFENPAQLAIGVEEPLEFSEGSFGILLAGGDFLGIEGDILKDVDRVSDLYNELGGGLGYVAAQSRLNSGTANNQDLRDAFQVISSVGALMEEGQGVYANQYLGVHVRLGSFGLYHNDATFAGIDPFADFGLLSGSALTDDTLPIFFGSFTSGALSPAAAALSSRIQNETTLGTADNDGDGTFDADELAFNAQQALGDSGISDARFQENLLQSVRATIANAGSGISTRTLLFNASGFKISGIRLRETGFSIGLPLHKLVFEDLIGFNAGLTIKEVFGETFEKFVPLRDIQDGTETLDDILAETDENTETSHRFTVDLGLSLQPAAFLNVALVFRNLIPMEFETLGGAGDFETKPQVRFGVQAAPIDQLKVFLDIDVLENEFTSVEDFASRMLSAGVELSVDVFKIRLGFLDNVSSDESKPVFSGGLGVDLFGIKVDVATRYSFTDVDIESRSLLTGTGDHQEQFGYSAMIGFTQAF